MPHTRGFLEDGIQLEEIQKKYSSEQDLFGGGWLGESAGLLPSFFV